MKQKSIHKKILKEGYYWEYKSIYHSLPDKLPIPENPFSKVNTEHTTEAEMVKAGQPFTQDEAFGLAAHIITENKPNNDYNIIWFRDYNGGLCGVCVGRGGDGWCVRVFMFGASREWYAGYRSFFRNGNSESLTSPDPLTLKNLVTDLIAVLKKYE